MRRAFGESVSPNKIRAMTRRCCQQIAMNILEDFRIPILFKEVDSPRFEVEGLEVLEAARQHNQGVCVVSLHQGNFELMIALGACRGFPLNIIYKEIHWKAAHDFWNLVRKTTGIKAIAPRRSKEKIKSVLAQGEFVGFAADQHMPPHRGIVCEFLGQLAATSPAASRFATQSGAKIILASTIRRESDPTQHLIRFDSFELESPFDTDAENIRHNTQRLNDWMSSIILAHPEQWLWHHKRFKIDQVLHQYEIPPHLEHLVKSTKA